MYTLLYCFGIVCDGYTLVHGGFHVRTQNAHWFTALCQNNMRHIYYSKIKLLLRYMDTRTRVMHIKSKCKASNFQQIVITLSIRSILFMALLKPLCYLTHKQRAIHIFLHWIFAWIIWTLFSSNVRIGISVVTSGSKSSRLVRIYLFNSFFILLLCKNKIMFVFCCDVRLFMI